MASTDVTPPALEILPTDSTEMKLAKLAKIEEADYSGMSCDQIYKTIWDCYNAAFDGNMAAITIARGEYWNAINN